MDKDRKCDNRSEDDKVITWDFYANSLAGWTDKKEAFPGTQEHKGSSFARAP